METLLMKRMRLRETARWARRATWLAALVVALGHAPTPRASDADATDAEAANATVTTGSTNGQAGASGSSNKRGRDLRDAAALLAELYPQGIPGNEPTVKSKATYTIVTVAPPAPSPTSASGREPATPMQGAGATAMAETARQAAPAMQLAASSDGKTTLTTTQSGPIKLVVIPSFASVASTAARGQASSAVLPAPAGDVNPNAVDVNRANAAQLAKKLKIDARRARLIIEFRQAYGPFKSPEDLAQVFGITDEMLLAWEKGGLIALP
jgi:DNA uptake protein ComE-like DNA-binding protein